MKSNIYTRTGDRGTTSLVDGSRINKDDVRLEAYGTIDELSSYIGLLSSRKHCPEEIKTELEQVQHILFEIGGYLATPPAEGKEPALEGLDRDLDTMEGWIDAIDERLPKLNSFVLPGGTEASGLCHVARTVCRRAERQIITLSRKAYVDPMLVAYINRFSDYLFVAARYLNFIDSVEEIAWHPRSRR